MRESRVAVCVATSTLELGIDIGDVDCVVVAEIPWSVSSLLQRIGRGSRRSEMVDVILIAPDDRAEAFLTAMLEAATAGLLDVGPYRPDLSVAVQQTFSGLFQNPDGLAVDELTALLSPIATPPQVKEILAHLSRLGWIEVRTGRWMASTRLMDLGEKGEIHTNIPDSAVHTVVDVDTGREIGQIVAVYSAYLEELERLGLRDWRSINTLIAERIEAGELSRILGSGARLQIYGVTWRWPELSHHAESGSASGAGRSHGEAEQQDSPDTSSR